MKRVRWYDRDGEPITVQQAEELLRDIDARIVAREQIGDRVVSTVHLVLDHALFDDGPPMIFETAVFAVSPEVTSDFDVYGRASTETTALAMHDQAAAAVRDGARRP